jgi:hypothetical protein
MSIGPFGGIVGSAAGAPLAKTSGTEAERSQKENSASQRLGDSQEKSERAAGIGTTEQDQGASDRDADGRRLWEASQQKQQQDPEQQGSSEENQQDHKSKDPSGDSGNELDLMG